MERVNDGGAREELLATEVINTQTEALEDSGGAGFQTLVQNIHTAARDFGIDGSPLITAHTDVLRELSHSAVVRTLPEHVGGVCTPSRIEIGTATVMVGQEGVAEATDRLAEVTRHELYHWVHGHTKPMAVPLGGSVIIADQAFGVVDVIEGLTVEKTGDAFVSQDYSDNHDAFISALARADLTIEDAEVAINQKKDVRLLDDATRRVSLAMAM